MGAINAEFLKQELWKYIDGDKIKAILGKAGDASWSPFKLDPVTGKPVGFQSAVIENSDLCYGLIRAGAIAIEKVCYDAKGVAMGGTKKEALVDWLNSVIDIPWVPESLEDNIIDFIIDRIIGWWNLTIGKDWVEKVPDPSIVTIKTA